MKETKPPIVNQQCVVYGFQCDLCDAIIEDESVSHGPCDSVYPNKAGEHSD